MRVYDRLPEKDPEWVEIFTVREWLEDIKDEWCCNYDGNGYWVKDDMESKDEVFSTEPEDATHVAWYNR